MFQKVILFRLYDDKLSAWTTLVIYINEILSCIVNR